MYLHIKHTLPPLSIKAPTVSSGSQSLTSRAINVIILAAEPVVITVIRLFLAHNESTHAKHDGSELRMK